MSKAVDQIIEIENFLWIEATIECGKCPKMDGIHADSDEAANHFYDEGWRVIDGEIYCKSCAAKLRKRLASKKKPIVKKKK